MPVRGQPSRGYPPERVPTEEHPSRACGPPRLPTRSTGLKAAREQGWHLRGPRGRFFGEGESAGKGERSGQGGGSGAEAPHLRTGSDPAGRRADREDLEVKRWQIVKKVIVRCPIYYSFIVG